MYQNKFMSKTGLVVGTFSPDRYTGKDFLSDVAVFKTEDIEEIKEQLMVLIMLKFGVSAKDALTNINKNDIGSTRIKLEKLAPQAGKELQQLLYQTIPHVTYDEGTAEDKVLIASLMKYYQS